MTCLEEICRKNKLCFQTELLENTYCSISFTRKINCVYLEEKKDRNGLYPCKLTEENIKLVEENFNLTEGKLRPTRENLDASIN